MLGSRSPASERAVAWRERVGGTARTGSVAETGEFGEVAILATLWGGTQNARACRGDLPRWQGRARCHESIRVRTEPAPRPGARTHRFGRRAGSAMASLGARGRVAQYRRVRTHGAAGLPRGPARRIHGRRRAP